MQSTYYSSLEKIEIVHAIENFLFSILDFRSQPNNLLSLSLCNCYLSIDSASILIHYLHSPHCMFHEVIVDECTISMRTDTKKKKICNLKSLKFQTAEAKSLVIFVRGLNQPTMMSHLILQPFFVTKLSHESDLQESRLEKCSMTDVDKSFVDLSSQHKNLHNLSLIDCVLSWKAIDALICFLQSPNCQLHNLELGDNCKISNTKGTNHTPCELKLELKAAKKFSLYISSSSQVINRMLSSQPHFYTSTLAELKIKAISPSGAIEFKTCFPVLGKLEIKGKNSSLFLSFLSLLEKNNLFILSLKKCNLNCESTMLLIQFLQSPYCRMRHVSLSQCNISFTCKNKHFGGLELLIEDAEKVFLTVTGSDLFISHILSKLTFYASSLNRLFLLVDSQPLSTATVENAIVHYPMLEKLKVEYCYSLSGSESQLHILSIKQNNLRSLSFIGLYLSSKATCSLFSVWQSPHSRLQKLSLKWCTISDNSQQTEVFLTTLKLQKLSTRTVSVYARGSSSIFQLLSRPNFYTNILDVTEMRLDTFHSNASDSSAIIGVFNIEQNYPMLETLQIDQVMHSTLPFALNFGSQTNNLCFLSLTSCRLNSLATRSLVDFLQSPHCKLHELTLDKCIITINDDTYQLQLKLKTNENISLNIAGSSFVIMGSR